VTHKIEKIRERALIFKKKQAEKMVKQDKRRKRAFKLSKGDWVRCKKNILENKYDSPWSAPCKLIEVHDNHVIVLTPDGQTRKRNISQIKQVREQAWSRVRTRHGVKDVEKVHDEKHHTVVLDGELVLSDYGDSSEFSEEGADSSSDSSSDSSGSESDSDNRPLRRRPQPIVQFTSEASSSSASASEVQDKQEKDAIPERGEDHEEEEIPEIVEQGEQPPAVTTDEEDVFEDAEQELEIIIQPPPTPPPPLRRSSRTTRGKKPSRYCEEQDCDS
jgi:hypothetical protein